MGVPVWLQSWMNWAPFWDDSEKSTPLFASLVCFRHRRGDAFSESLLHAVNDGGRLLLTHAKPGGRFVLRLAVGATYTERRHVVAAWDEIRRTAHRLASGATT